MRDLLSDTAALVNVASVSRAEVDLADLVERELIGIDGLEVIRVENNVIARTTANRQTRLLFGGHLDTVPPSGNERARIDDARCYGCGACDMKGGLAVMMELARTGVASRTDATYVFYACEEVARTESGLLAIDAQRPDLLACDAAILLEPTGAIVEAGCQGVVRVMVEIAGTRAHTARPWTGRNAIHRLGSIVDAIAAFDERKPVIDGCEFHETMQAVSIHGGVASNVVPDRVELELSMRFAPDRDVPGAISAFFNYFSDEIDPTMGDRITVVDSAPSAAPKLSSPLLSKLVAFSGKSPRAKLGWTDVAFFSERGIPATNFGPGDPELAHTTNEFVSRDDLEAVYDALQALLS